MSLPDQGYRSYAPNAPTPVTVHQALEAVRESGPGVVVLPGGNANKQPWQDLSRDLADDGITVSWSPGVLLWEILLGKDWSSVQPPPQTLTMSRQWLQDTGCNTPAPYSPPWPPKPGEVLHPPLEHGPAHGPTRDWGLLARIMELKREGLGVRKIADQLGEEGIIVSHMRVSRLLKRSRNDAMQTAPKRVS